MTAIDVDSGLNGNVSYFLAEGDRDKFEVDAVRGEIRLVGALSDRDVDHIYSLHVSATDKGTDAKTVNSKHVWYSG